MNQYMHPRNIYKNPPDFKQLANEYAEFRAVCKLKLNGKIEINFKNEETLRTLTKCLLKKDFQLDVNLPNNKLIPTLSLRLNYILWIEDIMNTFNIKNVHGIDIGCGASCIYPLLASTLYKWKMIGTEQNKDSILIANENITKNNLNDFIEIIEQNNSNEIFSQLLLHKNFQNANFSMCNPPFYSSVNDLCSVNNNRTENRQQPNNTLTGTEDELIFDGGEYEFIKNIILESCQLKERIQIYTTMIGHKYNVTKIINILKENGITNFIETEFCQGHTTRWGVAWTFSHTLLLRKVPVYGYGSLRKKSLTHTIQDHQRQLNDVYFILERLLNELQFTIINLFKDSVKITCDILGFQNTWSKQRRKRREQKRLQETSTTTRDEQMECDNQINSNVNYVCKTSINDNIVNSELEQNNCYDNLPVKRIKLDDYDNNNGIRTDKIPILVMSFALESRPKDIFQIDLEYLNGSSGKDSVHQILQFIINNYK